MSAVREELIVGEVFTKEKVKTILESESDEVIAVRYSRTQLCAMYCVVYGSGCAIPRYWRKCDILRYLRKYFATVARAIALEP